MLGGWAMLARLIASAGNPVLLSLLDSISGILKEHRREYGVPNDAKGRTRVIVEHDAIVEALAAHDARLAESRVARYMRMIWDQIMLVSSNKEASPQVKHPAWYFDSLVEEA